MVRDPRVQNNARRRGAVTAWLLVGLVVIIGIVAIGMDGGRMLDKRRHAQAAADAAALAGAASVFQIDITQYGNASGNKRTNAQTAGLAQAAANGFNNDGITSTVTVNYPPSSGVFAGQADFVEAIVQYNLPKSFGGIFTKNNLPVSARAVAVGRPIQLGVLALQQTGSSTFRFDAKGNMTVNNGAVFVNSSDAAAMAVSNKGNLSAASFSVTGNYTNTGTIQGQVYTSTHRVPDPLLALPVPDASGLSVQSSGPLSIGSAAVLAPGIYKGGINIGGSAVVLMLPGLYVMQGGGFQITGSADVVGLTPLIYNTTGTGLAGPININSTGAVALTASPTGAYQGISIIQDRALTQPLTLTGNGSTFIGGAVYAPAAPVNLAGNDRQKGDTLGTAIICASLYVGGNGNSGSDGNFTIDTTVNPLLVPQVTLVE
jgi:hypothetical protein